MHQRVALDEKEEEKVCVPCVPTIDPAFFLSKKYSSRRNSWLRERERESFETARKCFVTDILDLKKYDSKKNNKARSNPITSMVDPCAHGIRVDAFGTNEGTYSQGAITIVDRAQVCFVKIVGSVGK